MKILKKIFFVLLFIGSTANLFAQIQQKEANWWYFGYNSGLNFNILNTPKTSETGKVIYNLPTPAIGPISVREGVFTISDSEGNLLMSSDGSNIWNKNNVVMPNATNLGGNPSTSQSGITHPVPNQPKRYYVFSVAAMDSPGPLQYAIVDMTLNNGLGGILSINGVLQKNKIILTGVNGENITIVKNPIEDSFWLVHWSIQSNSTVFRVWKCTESNITLHSTETLTGTPNTLRSVIGILKFNVDGTRFVSTSYGSNKLYHGDFNPLTGIISNLGIHTTIPDPYGVEFSQNGELVYVSSLTYPLRQYTWSDIKANITSNAVELPYIIHNLQLAPDGRIYGIKENTFDLYVIQEPNISGLECDTQYLINYNTKYSGIGLPTFSPTFLNIIPEPQPLICKGNNFNFSVDIPLPSSPTLTPSELVWDWGDGSPTQSQPYVANQTKYTLAHTYATSNNFEIEVKTFRTVNGTQTLIGSTKFKRKITDCKLQVNRMIRVNVDNESTQKTKNP